MGWQEASPASMQRAVVPPWHDMRSEGGRPDTWTALAMMPSSSLRTRGALTGFTVRLVLLALASMAPLLAVQAWDVHREAAEPIESARMRVERTRG